MKKSGYLVVLGLVVFAALVFTMAASADSVRGTVVSVNASRHRLVIEPIEANEDIPRELNLFVQHDADLKNIASLDDLQEGNEVMVKVNENEATRMLEAEKVELIDGNAATSDK